MNVGGPGALPGRHPNLGFSQMQVDAVMNVRGPGQLPGRHPNLGSAKFG